MLADAKYTFYITKAPQLYKKSFSLNLFGLTMLRVSTQEYKVEQKGIVNRQKWR